MNKKDFELVSKILNFCEPSKQEFPRGYKSRLEKWNGIVEIFTQVFSEEFPRFNKEKFEKACRE